MNSTRQQHQDLPVPLCQLWSFYLPFQHDQLLAQEQVLCDQLTLVSLQIGQRIHDLTSLGWFCPLFEP